MANEEKTSLAEVLNEWRENISFRKELQENPEKALAKKGYVLSVEDLQKIKSMSNLDHSKKLGEDLEPKINK